MAAAASGCQPASEPPAETGEAAAGHEHVAPHGGALIALGDEFAHVEIVLDPVTGRLTAYVLDGEAERGVRIAQEDLGVVVRSPSLRIALAAVASPLTGERIGDTSQFEADAPELRGIASFDAVLPSITVRGQEFQSVPFNFPEGNEEE